MLLTQESPRHNLKLLWWLRTIAIAGQSATVAIVACLLHIALPIPPLIAIIAALAIINLLTLIRLKSDRAVTQREFFIQLLIDMLALAGLLYFTGGASNPFTSLFILQVVIAAIALPPFYCWAAAFCAIALYTLLMFCKRDLPMLMHHSMEHSGDVFSLHLQGMWVNFILLALLVAWFVARMSAVLRRQDMLLADAEQIAALGTLATQAAHDLGTPLATMAILAGEYRDDAVGKEQQHRAEVLRQQIQRCKESISSIAATAGVMRAESGKNIPLDEYVKRIIVRFCELRPDAKVELVFSSSPTVLIAAGVGLEQAISNLLANAADASTDDVRCEVQWTTQALTLQITDKGEGMPEAIRKSLGEPGISTKPQGLGMGLYLTQTVIARLGGTLEAQLPPEGGTRMRIVVPLKSMLS